MVSEPRGRISAVAAGGHGLHHPLSLRQVDLEGCTLPRLAIGADVAAILLHDSVHRRQPEPGSFPGFFGGEKRFKDARHGFFIHPATRVAETQNDIAAGVEMEMLQGVGFIQVGVRRPDRHLAPLQHGVARVDRQIHQDLLHLARIRFYTRQAGVARNEDLDVFSDQPAEHFFHFHNQGIQVQDDRLNHLLAAEGQELAGQAGRTMGGLGNFFGVAHQWVVDRQLHLQKTAVAGDHAEGVVEIVRHSPRQKTDGFHFLRLHELFLEQLALGDVLIGPFITQHRAILQRRSGRWPRSISCCHPCGTPGTRSSVRFPVVRARG